MALFEQILFWTLSVLAMAGGVGLITSRNPIYSALSVIVTFFCLGGLFLTLHAEFLAVIQIIVYAGAIMVLFLFIIMLLNLRTEDMEMLEFDWRRGAAFILGLAFVGEMAFAMSTAFGKFPAARAEAFAWGKVEPVGKALMTKYLLPFEMISVILLAALMGAILIAQKQKQTDIQKNA